MTAKKARYFPPKPPKLRSRVVIRKRKCDYCGDKEWGLRKLPNGLRRCSICSLPSDERKAARSKLTIKEGEGVIHRPGRMVKPVGSEELIVKPNQG